MKASSTRVPSAFLQEANGTILHYSGSPIMSQLVLGPRCPEVLESQLRSLMLELQQRQPEGEGAAAAAETSASSRSVQDLVTVVATLASEPDCDVSVVRAADGQLAVLKSYNRASLDPQRRLQVRDIDSARREGRR